MEAEDFRIDERLTMTINNPQTQANPHYARVTRTGEPGGMTDEEKSKEASLAAAYEGYTTNLLLLARAVLDANTEFEKQKEAYELITEARQRMGRPKPWE